MVGSTESSLIMKVGSLNMKPQKKKHSIYSESPGSPNLKKVQISKSEVKTIFLYLSAKQWCTKSVSHVVRLSTRSFNSKL
jgi:hypothetical protein